MIRWRHNYSSDDRPPPAGVGRWTDLGPVGRVREASHSRWEERRYDATGRPVGHHVSGVVGWSEEPLTSDDIDAYYWRHASLLERVGIVLVAMWHLAVALLICAIMTFAGGLIGLIVDPKGVGALAGVIAGFASFWVLGWVGSRGSDG